MLGIAGRFQQSYAACFDYLLAAYRADSFSSLGFEADLEGAHAKDTCDSMADRVLMVGQFWTFGQHDAIDVRDAETGFPDFGRGCGKHLGRIAAAVGRIGIGKHSANIGQRRRAQQRIGNGVQQHVGVAMTDKLPVVRHVDATQAQWAARDRTVRIFAESNTQVARGATSQPGLAEAKLVARIIPLGRARDNAERNAAKPQTRRYDEQRQLLSRANNSMVTAIVSSAGSLSRTSSCAPL